MILIFKFGWAKPVEINPNAFKNRYKDDLKVTFAGPLANLVVALIFSFIVMYDAAGVRRAAGKQDKLLNKIVETPGLTSLQVSERLVEVLGHTPVQVIVGAAIGVIVGLLV